MFCYAFLRINNGVIPAYLLSLLLQQQSQPPAFLNYPLNANDSATFDLGVVGERSVDIFTRYARDKRHDSHFFVV